MFKVGDKIIRKDGIFHKRLFTIHQVDRIGDHYEYKLIYPKFSEKEPWRGTAHWEEKDLILVMEPNDILKGML